MEGILRELGTITLSYRLSLSLYGKISIILSNRNECISMPPDPNEIDYFEHKVKTGSAKDLHWILSGSKQTGLTK